MMEDSVCRVAISGAKYFFDRLYDYDIPESLRESIQPGIRVLVPFGRSDQTREAIVVRMGRDPKAEYDRKEIYCALDTEPVLDEHLLRLAAYMCSTLFCTFYECAKTMLPSGLWVRHTEQYTLSDSVSEEEYNSLAEYRPILRLFTKRRRTVTAKEIEKKSGGILPTDILNDLCEQGILIQSQKFSRRVKDKTTMMYALALPDEEAMAIVENGRSPIRIDVVSVLIHEGSMNRFDLQYMTGASDAVLTAMVKKGILYHWAEETFRLPEQTDLPPRQENILSPSQMAAYQHMESLLLSGKPQAALLFGVTGSGKTQVYLKLIERVLQTGKGAIVLVPEIGLTPQVVRIFMAQFGECTAVLHSGLSIGERYDSWKRIRSGAARVVIGTRSAVFAPVHRLGLIILDEEQDDAYKSDMSPRYHARDIAKYRAVQENALVVLGSATPSIETFYGAQIGKYPMLPLRERYAGTQLPKVTIADMRGLTRQGYVSAVGPVLRQAIDTCLKDKHQCILFLNRRGALKQVTCTACGWVPECPSCSVSMTYHSANHRFMCHYCGRSKPVLSVCPNCGSTHLKTDGIGTQRLEEELHTMFPEAGILRMDADTTGTKGAHARLLSEFASGKADILLGTQMVTKGLDFDNVSLVGIIDADQALFAQDYRARERTFSLLTQVVGRAGRRNIRGHAVIQTYHPENDVILSAARQDYEQFYQTEIELRRALQCPPAAQIVSLTASARRERDVLEALMAVKARLEGLMAGQFADFCYPVLGPAPDAVVRIQNRYRYHLFIRCPDGKRRRELIGGVLREFALNSKFRQIAIYVDINPLHI